MPTRPWRPPQKPLVGQAFINWSHPLSRGLKYYWLLNENAGLPMELVSRTDWGAILSSGTTWTANAQGGVGLTFATMTDAVDINPTVHGNGNITVIGRGPLLDTASAHMLIRISGGAAGGVDNYRFRFASAAAGWGWELFGVVGLFSLTTTTAGHYYSAGCAYTREVGARFHIRDLTDLTTVTATALDASTPNSGAAGTAQLGASASAESWQNYLESIAVWNRALSDEEMAWYHENPLGLLQPSRFRVSYDSPAAGGGGGGAAQHGKIWSPALISHPALLT